MVSIFREAVVVIKRVKGGRLKMGLRSGDAFLVDAFRVQARLLRSPRHVKFT